MLFELFQNSLSTDGVLSWLLKFKTDLQKNMKKMRCETHY